MPGTQNVRWCFRQAEAGERFFVEFVEGFHVRMAVTIIIDPLVPGRPTLAIVKSMNSIA